MTKALNSLRVEPHIVSAPSYTAAVEVEQALRVGLVFLRLDEFDTFISVYDAHPVLHAPPEVIAFTGGCHLRRVQWQCQVVLDRATLAGELTLR